MSGTNRPWVTALCLALALTGWAEQADAGKKKPSFYRATASFTCGHNLADLDAVVPGDYATTIQVLNPGGATRARALVSLNHPTTERSDWVNAPFDFLASRQLDCADLLGGLFTFPAPLPPSDLFQGFVVIESTTVLDIVVLQTVQSPDGGMASTSQPATSRPVRGRVPAGVVEICHVPPGNPSNAHTIEVGSSAVPAHLAHGDSEGSCQP